MRSQWLETGRIVGTHGVHGEIKVEPWADAPSFLLHFRTVRIREKTFEVEQARVHKEQVLVKLAGVDTMDAAAALRGQVVYIDRTDAQLEDGAVFVADLIGLPVFADDAEIGKITEVISLPANDVYVVKGEHSYMIPVVKEFVLSIDTDAGVTVRLVEGIQTDAD